MRHMIEGAVTNGIHSLPVRVYYEDTDFSGNVYHANYLKFCERARSDFLRVLGLDQTAMFAEGATFVVRRIICDFLKPAKFDDVHQRVLRGEDVLFTADVTAVLVDGRGRPRRLTPELVKAMAATS
jgi:acyl-CoA thioester hydrolase